MAMGLPEMDRQLKILVENALEESQFENAIALLDQIRSPHYAPSPILLLHLLFISLHSATQPSRLDDPTQPVIDHATLLQQSPRKMMKHQRTSLVLSPAAVQAAHRLLHAFLRTNPAPALAPALPFYPESKNPQPVQYEYIDSPVHPQAVAIKNARTVWDVLRSDWLLKTYNACMAAQRDAHSKPRRSSALARDSSSFIDWEAQDDTLPVADDAWHTLDWLVALFEADADQSPAPKYSSILLRQLPPPRIGSHIRWDASEPLSIVFYAFKQPNPRYQRTGLRLFNLLLQLTYTSNLDLVPFASTVLTQISLAAASHAQAPHTHRSILTHLLLQLSSTSPAALAFKLVLCKKILALLEPEGAGGAQSTLPQAGSSTSMPSAPRAGRKDRAGEEGGAMKLALPPDTAKPRIRPRPLAKRVVPGAESPQKDSAGANALPSSQQSQAPAPEPAPALAPASAPAPAPPQIHIHLPPLAEIARLVRLEPSPPPPPPPLQIPGKTAQRNVHTPQQQQQTPWTTPPALVLQIKFELVRAWIGARGVRRAEKRERAAAAAGADASGEKEKEEWEREDAQLRALIGDVFGPRAGAMGEEEDGEEEEEERQRAFYRDALGVFLSAGAGAGAGAAR